MLRDRRLLILLAAGSLTNIAGGVVAPVLPEMVKQLHFDPALAANLVSMHCLTIALFSPPLGILADQIGHLRVLVPSLIFYALFGVAGAFTPNFWPLLATRALLGAASGGIAAAALGLLGNLYEGEERSQALGLTTSTIALSGIAFPLIGGWVGATHWQYAFYLYGLGLPIAAMAAVGLREKPKTKAKPKAKAEEDKLLSVLRHPQTQRLLLTLGLTSVAMYAVVIYAPLYLEQKIGADTVVNGIVLASRAVGAAMISALGAKRLAKAVKPATAMAMGFGLMALTLITIPWLNQLSWILLTAVLFGVGFGIVLPTLYSTLANLAPSSLKSSVLAIGTGAGFLGQFLSPVLLGPMLSYGGLEGVFYAAAGISMIAGLLLLERSGKKSNTELLSNVEFNEPRRHSRTLR
ncbi:MFS transporter [Microcoleus sp. FACHB-53]|nr:MFS transporter [Microcoleus sp. FACHB-53]